ncbi:MAG: GIY-YIG nuclease family protein [Desulfurivibrionaceae bacterium]
MCTDVHEQADNTADSVPSDPLPPDAPWYVYMVVCNDRTIYTGIARDLQKRVHNHNHGKTGARYTRSRRPVKLVYREAHPSRSAATVRECQLKKLTRTAKLRLIAAASLTAGSRGKGQGARGKVQGVDKLAKCQKSSHCERSEAIQKHVTR